MSTTPPTTSPHIDQVRSALLATLSDLRNRESPMDLDRAKAVATVARDRSVFLSQPDPTLLPGPANGITSITRHQLKG